MSAVPYPLLYLFASFKLQTKTLPYSFIDRNTFVIHSCFMNDDTVQMNLKVPADLRDLLKAAADQNHRSMTAELIARLYESLQNDPAQERTNRRLEELEARLLHLEQLMVSNRNIHSPLRGFGQKDD